MLDAGTAVRVKVHMHALSVARSHHLRKTELDTIFASELAVSCCAGFYGVDERFCDSTKQAKKKASEAVL